MSWRAAIVLTALASSAPAAAQNLAQNHAMPGMAGMSMPMAKPPAKRPPAKKAKPPSRKAPAAPAPASDAIPGMDMSHGGMDHDMATMPGVAPAPGVPAPSGTDLPAGTAPPPAPPGDRYAARFFPAAAMDRAHARMMREEGGGGRFHQVVFNLAEYQPRGGRDGYRWDGEIWFGGDIDRLVVKSEGAGSFGDGIDTADGQVLFSRAIGPYFNLQGGVRHAFSPRRARTDATIAVEGLAPYMIETEAALFLSTHGEFTARIEGWYDQRLTQRLILQPRVELNLSAQNVPRARIGAGLSDAELGLRLRYEIAREFAPYVGLSHDAKTGRTADYARADGHGAHDTSLVAGVRFWF